MSQPLCLTSFDPAVVYLIACHTFSPPSILHLVYPLTCNELRQGPDEPQQALEVEHSGPPPAVMSPGWVGPNIGLLMKTAAKSACQDQRTGLRHIRKAAFSLCLYSKHAVFTYIVCCCWFGEIPLGIRSCRRREGPS